jgi:ketosteroid isomerase-like protein
MSRENVDLARRLYEDSDLLNATTEQLDRVFREDLDEHFEFRLPPDYPEGELVFRGRDGINQLIALLDDTWSEWQFRPERFLDAGDRVVVFARIVGKGAASGVPVDLETTHVWTIHAGRASSVHAYRDRSQALEAAGLNHTTIP